MDLLLLPRLVLLALWFQCAASYKSFQLKIPNGNMVPLPCKTDKMWPGVGHLVVDGTGTRNQFGKDFEEAGKEWTKDLCRKDSDRDGLTNGAELGDPDCTWSPGQTPKRTTGVSHPGVCDPWNSSTCMQRPMIDSRYPTQKDWLDNVCVEFNCSAIQEPGVFEVSVRLTNTNVPPKETTYMCQMFNVYDLNITSDGSVHLVAVMPIVNNTNVLHHMVLTGCQNGVDQKTEPFECDMLADNKCKSFLHVWGVGVPGECLHPNCGIRLGQGGYSIIALQLHWNNPQLRSDFTDSSGLMLYYTSKLRQFNAGVLVIGREKFWLPPQKPHITVESTCSSVCTQTYLRGDLKIYSAANHMHYAGSTMSIKKISKNQTVTYLTNDPVYRYDSPQIQRYKDLVTLQPGDALVTTCGFNTMSRNKTTFWGDATMNEMCYGFLSYYPEENVSIPLIFVDNNGISQCDTASHRGCQIETFVEGITHKSSTVFKEVQENCRRFRPCLDECVATLTKHMKTDPCLQENVWDYIQDRLITEKATEFLENVSSCKAEVYLALNPSAASTTTTTRTTSKRTSTGNTATATTSIGVSITSLALVTSYAWR